MNVSISKDRWTKVCNNLSFYQNPLNIMLNNLYSETRINSA